MSLNDFGYYQPLTMGSTLTGKSLAAFASRLSQRLCLETLKWKRS